jgi:predicted nucleic acid-binding protein
VGSLTLPTSGLVYADAQTFLYSVEKHPDYAPLLRPLWQAAQAGTLEVVSSELALMETLVGPLKKGDAGLCSTYEQFFQQGGMRLLPITLSVLRDAARLRATTKLRTPDALHAATAQLSGCALFLTNDFGFRGIAGLPLAILQDVLTA